MFSRHRGTARRVLSLVTAKVICRKSPILTYPPAFDAPLGVTHYVMSCAVKRPSLRWLRPMAAHSV